ncbi:DMT family transporter [Alkalicoccobacillus murimartini]|uniref:Paired small multidrug resistance pump n=1 Tax=Alkalicoccobacillus murimartini TaxID=171685 RepID=A0ABT9YL62_9BACI|nr:multidrug efflux SMR transporter [Alkalicoccobacillus murimartini]MDQ0208609.1 paired small multidrug resistance pump [Alkalicoccobacillus murimartini]
MSWMALLIAGCLEVVGVLNVKRLGENKKNALYYMVLSFGLSFFLLSYAMNEIPMGMAYATWTGIGTVGSALLGMIIFNESRDWKRLFCIGLILFSAVGLKVIV